MNSSNTWIKTHARRVCAVDLVFALWRQAATPSRPCTLGDSLLPRTLPTRLAMLPSQTSGPPHYASREVETRSDTRRRGKSHRLKVAHAVDLQQLPVVKARAISTLVHEGHAGLGSALHGWPSSHDAPAWTWPTHEQAVGVSLLGVDGVAHAADPRVELLAWQHVG